MPCEFTLKKKKKHAMVAPPKLINLKLQQLIYLIYIQKSPAAYFSNHSSKLNVNSPDKPFKSLGKRVALLKLRTFGSIMLFL